MKVLNGSISAGQLLDNPSDVYFEIVGSLDAVNDKYAVYSDRDLKFIEAFISDVEGENGTIVSYEYFDVFFGDNGIGLNPQDFNESYEKWSLNSRSYAIKNASFEPELFKSAEIRGQDVARLVMDRTDAIIRKYQNVFKKNIAYEALMTIPTTGGSYLSKKGALLNTVVKDSMLEDVDSTATAGDLKSTTRNHWRTVASSTLGLTFEDIQFYKAYLSEYVDVDESNILCLANNVGMGKFLSVYDSAARADEFKITGTPTETIDGVQIVKSNVPSNDMLIFIAGSTAEEGSNKLITRLQDPLAKYQGLGIIPINPHTRFHDAYDLIGAKFVIQNIGYEMTGRHYVLFVDINANRASSDRIMQAGGFAEIQRRKNFLHGRWYRGVNEVK